MTSRNVLTLVLLAAASGMAAAAAPIMQPGQWEITTKTEMPGMPMAMPPQVIRHCYRAEDLKDTRDTIPVDKSCKLDDLNQTGNTVTWKVSCKTESGPMSGQGKVTHSAQSYSGTMTLKGRMEGQDFAMNSTYSARRIGDCK